MDKGFKQVLVKTGIFAGLFILISLILGQRIVASSLLYGFKIFIYGGMGKILLFSILGFVLLFRERLLKLKSYEYEKKNLIFLLVSLISAVGFYVLELNISFVSVNLINTVLIHALFLSIFGFLGLGVFGLEFIKDFFKRFKKELLYFLIFGIIVYSLMNLVWKLWPYLSLIVSKITYNLLGAIGDSVLIDAFTISFNGFSAQIGEACSGIYSIFIFSALYLFAIILDWKKLNKKKILLVFIPAVLGAFLVNILRVFLFFVMGAFISEQIAIGLYHSYTGMIFFLVYFTIFWLLFYEWMKKKEFKSKQDGFVRSKYKKIMNDSLYKNSIYLMISTGIMSVLGFVFWMVIARLFTTHDVGLATTIISVMGLITGLSVLGLNVALIRYLPRAKDKSKKIDTCFTLVAIVSVIVTSVYLMGIGKFSPDLYFIKENLILAFSFILFMVLAGFNSLMESIFVAFRSTKYILIKNTIFSFFKIIIPFGFISLGFLGAYVIFSSWMIAIFIGFCFSLFILIKKFEYKPKFVCYDSIIKHIGQYSFGNYIAGFIGGLPLMILPILILNKLGAEQVAYYYMSMMIAGLLFVIPGATTQSLFAEGSYNEGKLKEQVKKAVKIISLIMIPGILITVFFGDLILLAFGKEYATEGFRFLQIVALSGVFVGVNGIFGNVFRVKKRMKEFIFVNILRACLIVGGIYFLLDKGLVGIGIGWLIGVGLTTLVYIIVIRFSRKARRIER